MSLVCKELLNSALNCVCSAHCLHGIWQWVQESCDAVLIFFKFQEHLYMRSLLAVIQRVKSKWVPLCGVLQLSSIPFNGYELQYHTQHIDKVAFSGKSIPFFFLIMNLLFKTRAPWRPSFTECICGWHTVMGVFYGWDAVMGVTLTDALFWKCLWPRYCYGDVYD